MNNKGFTIVEMVIVIAVIAILIAVLFPTFSSMIKTANESNAMTIARQAFYNWASANVNDVYPNKNNVNFYIEYKGIIFEVEGAEFISTPVGGDLPEGAFQCSVDNDTLPITFDGENFHKQ